MPLRPELFKRLEERFHVQIANEGEEMVSEYSRDALTGKPSMWIRSPGEYYRVCCPFCSDTTKRLWINHMWGFKDPITGDKNLHLCICYNENCFKDNYPRRKSLYADIFGDVGDGSPDVVLKRKGSSSNYEPPFKFEWPGNRVPLDQLPAEHPAIAYLQGRGFDPKQLSEKLGVTCCTAPDPCWQIMRNRILIPVTMNGKLQGWQARCIGAPRHKFDPKYYTMPSMKKSEVLYNLDKARNHASVVLVEGVTDVWRVGPSAVAMFGKTLSDTQALLLGSSWCKGTVYVMLDGDAQEDARKTAAKLQGRVGRCVIVDVPEGRDPGDLTPMEIQRLLAKADQTTPKPLLSPV